MGKGSVSICPQVEDANEPHHHTRKEITREERRHDVLLLSYFEL